MQLLPGPAHLHMQMQSEVGDKSSGQLVHLTERTDVNNRRTRLRLLPYLPSCSAAQTLPSSAWDRQMRSKNHKGATQSPMSSSLFSLLSQLFVTPAFLCFFPLLPLSLCWVHGGTSLLPAVPRSLFACLLSHTDGFFFPSP